MIDTLVRCEGCHEEGYLGDEVHYYDLPTTEDVLTPLCLDCGPEENYGELYDL